jgi:hypothetical protein
MWAYKTNVEIAKKLSIALVWTKYSNAEEAGCNI